MTLPLSRATRPLRHVTVLVLVAVCSLALGVGAWAFWSTSGTGAGSASTGTLNPPTNVTASASGATVTVSWTPPATGSSPLGYYVTRTGAGTSAACGTSPGSLKSASPCSDTSVPDGTYTYTVTAVRNGWSATSASSASVSVANPIKLGFTSQPGNGTSQNALSPQPVVAVQTASGSTVTSATSSVTLALTSPGGATLSCTSNPVAAVAGVATFAGCNIDQAGGSYTLTATAAGLASATSDTFTVSAGNGSKMVFNTDPGNGTGGTALTTQPTVTVRDAFGNTATSSSASVTLALTTPGGATLACTSNPVTAVSGVATFAGCQVNLVGAYTLTATSGGVTSATSATFTVAAGAATRLTFTTQPSTSTVSQVAFAAQPAVTVLDAGGNTVATATDSVSLALTTPGGATLTCTLNPKSPTSGVVGFAGCKVDLVGSYTLTASASGLTPVTSTGVTITPAAASKLAFTTQPSNGNGGTALATQPVVTVRDASGNAVTTASNAVTLTLTTPGGAILACPTNPLTASSGVATYTGCKVDKAGSYTLTAAATGLTSALSTSFTVSVGAASQLGFTTQPGGGASQAVWGAQPVVAVQDAGGNTVTSATNTVTLALTTANGGTLTCTPTNSKAAVAGVATFAGCKVDKAGSNTLTATATSLTSATSASFTITAGAASKLAFTTQPSAGTGGTALATQPTVTVQDAFGNTVVGDTSSVTLALAPATSTLTCTANPKAAVAGVATFGGCKLDKTGTYTFTATDGSLTSVTSSNFTITVGPASQLGFTIQPSASSTSQFAFGAQPKVTVQDAGGNTVTTASTPVTLSLTSAGGATLVCTTNPVSPSSGVATFGGCKVDKTGTYTLTAAASGLTSGTSSSFTITAGPAATLVFTAAPTTGSASSNANIGPFTVQIRDAAGNPAVSSGSTSVSLSAATSGSGTASFATTSGAAGSATLVLAIPTGTSESSFYFGWSQAKRSPVITATSGTLSNGTTTVTVN